MSLEDFANWFFGLVLLAILVLFSLYLATLVAGILDDKLNPWSFGPKRSYLKNLLIGTLLVIVPPINLVGVIVAIMICGFIEMMSEKVHYPIVAGWKSWAAVTIAFLLCTITSLAVFLRNPKIGYGSSEPDLGGD